MMNSRQINRIIRRHVREFDGVYSSDNLPQHDPKLLMANTDPSDRPGDHWTAISIDGKEMENISIRRELWNMLELGCITELSFRVLLANFLDSIVSFGVYLAVEN